jgi:hypothetical protein
VVKLLQRNSQKPLQFFKFRRVEDNCQRWILNGGAIGGTFAVFLQDVGLQTGLSCKCFIVAEVTQIWLLSRVNPCVGFEMVGSREFLFTGSNATSKIICN